jgi:hypothetical protein
MDVLVTAEKVVEICHERNAEKSGSHKKAKKWCDGGVATSSSRIVIWHEIKGKFPVSQAAHHPLLYQ